MQHESVTCKYVYLKLLQGRLGQKKAHFRTTHTTYVPQSRFEPRRKEVTN